ncbi:MAG: PAS domain S-box protein [Chloroflexi bacterium]|nr:PAS domain S-box protein [Chloroflexota bacterium]
MSLSLRTLLVIVIAVSALIGTIYAFTQVIFLENYVRLEEQNLHDHVQRVQDILADRLDRLNSSTSDWASFDDTYAFIENGNQAYIDANPTDMSFTLLDVNVMLFIHSSGRIVFSKAYDPEKHLSIPVPEQLKNDPDTIQFFLQYMNSDDGLTGILLLPQAPLLVATRPILTSEGQGPAQGVLVFGRYLDEAVLAELGQSAPVSITAYRFQDTELAPDVQAARSALSAHPEIFVHPRSDQAIDGYTLLNDVFDKPALVIRVERSREVYAQGLSSVRMFIFYASLVLILCGAFVWRQTDRLEQSQHKLRASEERFRRLAESAQDIIYRYALTPHPRIEYVNPAVHRILGYSPEEFYADPRLFLSIIHPDDLDKIASISNHEIELIEYPVLRWINKSGAVVWTEHRHTPVYDEMGRLVLIEGIARDVTERQRVEEDLRKSEEKFRAVMDTAPDIVSIVSPDGSFIYNSPAGERIHGYPSDMFKDHIPFDLIHPDDIPELNRRWALLLSNPTTVQTIDYRHRHRAGHYVWLESIAKNMLDNPAIGGIIILTRDVSERKQHANERDAIAAISKSLRIASNRSEMLPILLDQVNALFQAEGALFALMDPISRETIVELGRGSVGANFTGARLPSGQGVSTLVVTTGKPYLNNDVRHDARFALMDRLGDANAVACAPLIARDQTIGVLWLLRKSDIAEDELRLLLAIADIAASAIQRTTLHEQTEQQLHRLSALHQIDTAINTSLDLRIALDVLLTQVVSSLRVDAADVLVWNPNFQTLDYAAGFGFRTREIERSHVRLGSGQAGLAALKQRLVAFPDLTHAETNFERAALLAGEKFASHFVMPLVAKGHLKGVLEVFDRNRLDPPPGWLEFFEALGTQAAIAIDNATLFDNLQRSNMDLILAYDATIEGWSYALELRDRETNGHTQRVVNMSLRLARVLGMRDGELMQIRRGALLHDIGKMAIPDSILLKPGPLTVDEWQIMRNHPTYAYELISPINYLRPALDIPYCHHEKWDGTGYPRGLKGVEIPLAARLFAVVDVWDALRSERPYRAAWSIEQALHHIESEAGTHFDPQVVEAFLRIVRAGELTELENYDVLMR